MWGSPGESWDLTTEHQREVVKDFKASMMDGSLITFKNIDVCFQTHIRAPAFTVHVLSDLIIVHLSFTKEV